MMEKNEIERNILDYLQNHYTISLATENDGIPHAATVFFVNIGFTIFFVSSPTSRHSQNIINNSKVSGTVNEDYSDWPSIKGLQLEGEVREIGSVFKNINIARNYVSKYKAVKDFFFSPENLGAEIANKIAGVKFYEFKPSKIFFINNELAFGNRYELVFNENFSL